LIPYREDSKPKREFGIYEGEAKIPDDFDDEVEEINRLFYGGGTF